MAYGGTTAIDRGQADSVMMRRDGERGEGDGKGAEGARVSVRYLDHMDSTSSHMDSNSHHMDSNPTHTDPTPGHMDSTQNYMGLHQEHVGYLDSSPARSHVGMSEGASVGASEVERVGTSDGGGRKLLAVSVVVETE
eukprot:2330065-Rhodomonas_salina.1